MRPEPIAQGEIDVLGMAVRRGRLGRLLLAAPLCGPPDKGLLTPRCMVWDRKKSGGANDECAVA